MTDPKTTPEMEEYVGKILGVDFTEKDLQEQFSEYDIRIAELGKLAFAGLYPNRLKVWIDEDGKVIKIITG